MQLIVSVRFKDASTFTSQTDCDDVGRRADPSLLGTCSSSQFSTEQTNLMRPSSHGGNAHLRTRQRPYAPTPRKDDVHLSSLIRPRETASPHTQEDDRHTPPSKALRPLKQSCAPLGYVWRGKHGHEERPNSRQSPNPASLLSLVRYPHPSTDGLTLSRVHALRVL
jgi:hypothetical protein